MVMLSVYFSGSRVRYGVDEYHYRSDRVRAIASAMNLIPVIWSRINATATFDTDGGRLSF